MKRERERCEKMLS